MNVNICSFHLNHLQLACAKVFSKNALRKNVMPPAYGVSFTFPTLLSHGILLRKKQGHEIPRRSDLLLEVSCNVQVRIRYAIGNLHRCSIVLQRVSLFEINFHISRSGSAKQLYSQYSYVGKSIAMYEEFTIAFKIDCKVYKHQSVTREDDYVIGY